MGSQMPTENFGSIWKYVTKEKQFGQNLPLFILPVKQLSKYDGTAASRAARSRKSSAEPALNTTTVEPRFMTWKQHDNRSSRRNIQNVPKAQFKKWSGIQIKH